MVWFQHYAETDWAGVEIGKLQVIYPAALHFVLPALAQKGNNFHETVYGLQLADDISSQFLTWLYECCLGVPVSINI